MSVAQPTTAVWTIDAEHSAVEFAIRYLRVATVRGHFRIVEGRIRLDEEHPASSSVTATIDAASVQTREERRDAHLRNADFFDVETWPTISFASTAVRRPTATRWEVVGDLTMHGVTRAVTLDVEDHGEMTDPLHGNTRRGFVAETTILRSDWGLTFNAVLETGGVALADRVQITLDVSAVR